MNRMLRPSLSPSRPAAAALYLLQVRLLCQANIMTNNCVVTEAEFAAVSTLIKGRVKLVEVNHVRNWFYSWLMGQAFEVIFNAFKKDKKRFDCTPQARSYPRSEQITIKEVTTMGLIVTGATGEAKLKVWHMRLLC